MKLISIGNFLQYLPFTLLKLKNLQALWMNENQVSKEMKIKKNFSCHSKISRLNH